MTKELKYTQLLDLEWTLQRSEITAKREWDQVVEYGKDDLLYQIHHDDVKRLREARKTLKQVIDILRENDLYANGG